MTYKLEFLSSAYKEWQKLDASVQAQFKKKLAERLINPEVLKARLSGFPNHYKIKLRSIGYRLVYEIVKDRLCIIVIAIGKRDKDLVYKYAQQRSR